MTELMERIAYDYEWELKEIEEEEIKIASFFSYNFGMFINVPYNGHDGNLIQTIKKYSLDEKEKVNARISYNKKKESASKDEDFPSFNEYLGFIKEDFCEVGTSALATLKTIYGNVSKNGIQFLDFPSIEECDELLHEKDPIDWLLYIKQI